MIRSDIPMLVIQYEGKIFSSVCFFDQRLGCDIYDGYYSQHSITDNVLRDQFPSTICALEAKKKGGKGVFSSIIASKYGNKARSKRLYNAIQYEWYKHSRSIMDGLLRQKFSESNPAFLALLMSTDDLKMYELKTRNGSVWEKDTGRDTWGFIGEILMKIRSDYRVKS